MVKEFLKFTWPVACTGRDRSGVQEGREPVRREERPCMQGREPCVLGTCRT